MVSIQPRPCDILLVAAAGLSMTCSPLRSTIWSAPPPRSSPTYWWHSRDSGRAELRGERRVVSTGRRDSTSWRSKARSAALMATPSISSRATSSWPKGSRWWNPRWQPQDPPHRGPARLPGPLLPLRPRQTVGARHPPDFPSVARIITSLYPRSGGRPVDGVIAVSTTTPHVRWSAYALGVVIAQVSR